MSDNLVIWNKVRAVPPEAQKPIQGGRLKGKTDINPVWRLKFLTEQFGLCGIGWYTEITKQWTEAGANGEISAFVNIDLYIKHDGEWSKPIPGTGGSSFVAKESGGLYVSDECYKMAYTDAISVACKALGFGADVYWEKDSSKYDKPQNPPQGNKPVGNVPSQPKPQEAAKNDSVPSDIEKRASKIYFTVTGNKEGQLGWPLEQYKQWLKDFKDVGAISTDYGKKWNEKDLIFLEAQIEEVPF